MKRTLVCALILVLASCSHEAPPEAIPDYVLDKEKFSKVLCDFTLAESAAGINVKNARADKLDSVYAFDPLADNHISRKDFDTSLYFYSHHPTLFKEAFQLAMEKLSQMQSSRK